MARKDKGTKDLFLQKALELFAERGYKAVSVAQIAAEVGCTAPALYKHYQSKKDLFDAILEASNKGYEESMEKVHVNYDKHSEERESLIGMTEKEQVDTLKNLFLHTLTDEWAKAFRKLLMVEQFHMPGLAEIYNERYVYAQIRRHEVLFKVLIEEGVVREADPGALAVTYISPIIVLIGVCDRDGSKIDWALETIEKHVKEFNRAYRMK